jgi:signal transduction histidine kinase
LTIWYTGVLAMLLLLFGSGVYIAVSYILSSQVDATLQRGSETLDQAIVEYVRSGRELILPTSNIGYIYIRPDGKIYAISENLKPLIDKTFGSYDFAKLTETSSLVADTSDYTLTGSPVRVLTRPVVGEKRKVLAFVQIVTWMDEVEGARRSLLTALLWSAGIATVISALIGAFLAWRALRPVTRITQTALDILNTGNLSQRVPITSKANDEVGQLAQAFNNMLDRLSRSFAAQQRLVADVSHELRTPLTVLRGNVDLLRNMGCSPNPIPGPCPCRCSHSTWPR